MSKKRPIHLKLHQIRFPITAIASIGHRLSGIFVFLLVPWVLWIFQQSLTPQGFVDLQATFSNGCCAALIWLLVVAFLYHLLAGIRHLVMDFGLGETLNLAKMSAMIVLLLTLILAISFGFFLWG
jgi:succinate dehydrogenase / fumarate reductase cytochrome b subunit